MAAANEITFRPPEDEDTEGRSAKGPPTPGLVLIYAVNQPTIEILPLADSPLEIGRTHAAFSGKEDAMMSRQHARVAFRDERFEITDLGSRNGSALHGKPFSGSVSCDAERVLRLGHSLFLLCRDVEPYRTLGLKVQDGRIEGPGLQRALRSVAGLAEHSRTLFIVGESGAGKESLAQAFHRTGPQRRGPFIAVNCATIPEGLAERLLFGAQKGTYTGAQSDSEGYIQAASGGTLFLDEVADLDAPVQAKLLRTLESREVLPLGATQPKKVDVRVCSATHKDLRAQATLGTFRADLYFRLGMPQVLVPPLRKRLEEIPWYIAHAAAKVAPELKVAALLVEACLLRNWPGNIRELLAEINTAAVNALSAGAAAINPDHLSENAGTALIASSPPAGAAPSFSHITSPQVESGGPPSEDLAARQRAPLTRAQLMLVLVEAKGNLSKAARTLGLHRTQLRRYLEDHSIDLGRIRELAKS